MNARIPSKLPVTAEQSRVARFQLGLTQANVIEESGLPGYKLKNFETGKFSPDIPFLEGLRDFYTGRGIVLDGQQNEMPTEPKSGGEMVRSVHRMCFYVSDDLSEEQVDQVLSRMDANDVRIAGILKEPAKLGLMSGYDEETEVRQRELFGAMAENYLAFRLLQGRNIVKPQAGDGDKAQTHADLLAAFFAASPLNAISAEGEKKEGGEE